MVRRRGGVAPSIPDYLVQRTTAVTEISCHSILFRNILMHNNPRMQEVTHYVKFVHYTRFPLLALSTFPPRPPTSKVKVARSRDQCWPGAVPVSLEPGGGIQCQPNPAATLLVLFAIYTAWLQGMQVSIF